MATLRREMALLTEAVECAKVRCLPRADAGRVPLLELLGGPISLHFIIMGDVPPLDAFAGRIVSAV